MEAASLLSLTKLYTMKAARLAWQSQYLCPQRKELEKSCHFRFPDLVGTADGNVIDTKIRKRHGHVSVYLLRTQAKPRSNTADQLNNVGQTGFWGDTEFVTKSWNVSPERKTLPHAVQGEGLTIKSWSPPTRCAEQRAGLPAVNPFGTFRIFLRASARKRGNFHQTYVEGRVLTGSAEATAVQEQRAAGHFIIPGVDNRKSDRFKSVIRFTCRPTRELRSTQSLTETKLELNH